MRNIDDAMVAMVLRFAIKNQDVDYCNREFLREQVNAIQIYVDNFPVAERQARAVEWAERYARDYRRRWTRKLIQEKYSQGRCHDCPLGGEECDEHCEIHEQWLSCLELYEAREIDTKSYVERVLKLLEQHKESVRENISRLQKI